MAVTVVTSLAEVASAGTIPRCSVPFYGGDWLAGYEKSGLCGGSAVYVFRSDGDRIAEMLPVYAVANGDPLGLVRRGASRTVVTHGWHCYDTRILADDPSPVGFMRAVVDALAPKADVLWLCNAGPGAASVAQDAAPDDVVDMSPRYRLDLSPYTDFDSYVASRSRNLRRDIIRHRARAADAGLRVNVVPVRDSDRVAIAELAAALAYRHGTPWYYNAARFADMLEHLSDPRRFTAVELWLGDVLVGASVLLRQDDVVHLWAGGSVRNGDQLNFSPGTVLFAAELELAISLGARWVEGGRSNGHYKERFGFEAIQLKGFRWALQARR